MPTADLARYTMTTATVGTTWAALVTDGSFDVTVDAVAGDVIEVGVSSIWSNVANFPYLDAATMVSGSPVNWVSTGTSSHGSGPFGWFSANYLSAPVAATACGSWFYTVQSGDVVSGQVTFRLYGKTLSGTRAMIPTADFPAQMWAAVCDTTPSVAALSGTLTTSGGVLTGSATVDAVVGDTLAIVMNALVNPNAGAIARFDACTYVSGAPAKWVSTATSSSAALGVAAWYSDIANYESVTGTVLYTVQSGDVVSGQVTIRIGASTDTLTRTIETGSYFAVRNVT